MGRSAPRVHTQAGDIAAIERIALQLPQDRPVRLRLDDGSELQGIVAATPSMQAFFDPAGHEGMNALVRIEAFLDDGRAHPGGSHDVWLDRIDTVTPLPDPSPPETSSRTSPPDPNAPTSEP